MLADHKSILRPKNIICDGNKMFVYCSFDKNTLKYAYIGGLSRIFRTLYIYTIE